MDEIATGVVVVVVRNPMKDFDGMMAGNKVILRAHHVLMRMVLTLTMMRWLAWQGGSWWL